MISVACIVEGHGDVDSAPILFRRISEREMPEVADHLLFPHPIRIPKDKLMKVGELERAVNLAGRRVRPAGCIFIVIDADKDCPAELGPAILNRAHTECGDLPIAAVLAKAEWENWFVAAAESIRRECGLSDHVEAPAHPEEIRGAKEWLTGHMPSGEPYSETLHQASLTRVFDLNAARQADSFDKCYREISRVLRELVQDNDSA